MTKINLTKNLFRQGFKMIELYGINERGECTCYKGRECGAAGKHPVHNDWRNHYIRTEQELETIIHYKPYANFGIITGDGLVVVDIDAKSGGLGTLEDIRSMINPTFTVNTGGGGYHFYYKTDQVMRNRTNVFKGVDIRGDGGYVVAPSSKHKSGNFYTISENADVNLANINPKLLSLITQNSLIPQPQISQQKVKLANRICEGERHDKLVRLCGALSRQGYDLEALTDALLGLNETLCEVPLPEDEVRGIAKSIHKYKNFERNPDLHPKETTRTDEIIKLLYTNKGTANERNSTITRLIIEDLKKKAILLKPSMIIIIFIIPARG